jgi:hypothetical protein
VLYLILLLKIFLDRGKPFLLQEGSYLGTLVLHFEIIHLIQD